jgi:hypothetical protein
MSNFSVTGISWLEQAIFQWHDDDNDDVHFVLDQYD